MTNTVKTTKKVERVIFDNDPCSYNFEEHRKEMFENYPELYDNKIENVTDSKVWDDIYSCIEFSLDAEIANLNKETNGILIIADLGLWNGRHNGVVKHEATNLNSILNSHINGQSSLKVTCGRYNVEARESHHDGTNYYTFREWKDYVTEEQKEKVREHIQQYGYDTKYMSKYTRSLNPIVKQIYGW